MDNNIADKDIFIEALLQERDNLYLELSKLQQRDQGEQQIERYEAVIRQKDDQIKRKDNQIKHKEVTIKHLDDQVKKLTDQLEWYRRKFWKPSSERYIPQDPNQRKIDFDGMDVVPEEEQAIQEAAKEIISYERRKPEKPKKQPVRLPLPEHLRREEEVIEPEGIDENWIRIGEEVTEVLEHKPGELYVRRIVRPKYVLRKDLQQQEVSEETEKKKVLIAELPLMPLPRSNAGASLLAELLMGKYVYHLPFHRQIAFFKQVGVSIPASTISGWFTGCGDLLRALYYRLREIILATDYIQVDESTIPIVNDEKHRTVKAYLWVVRSVMENLMFFHYDDGSRSQKVVTDLLLNYKGAIQTDGYEAYSIYEKKKGVLLLGCWAHCRRKFSESLKEDHAGATYALEQIGMLYKVETMATEQNMDYEQRAALRRQLAYPIICAFEKWILNYFPKTLPKGRMQRALSYTYKLLHRLSRYHLDGRYHLDNNLVENSIRGLALGRRNWLFCKNHGAAENAAIMYSLFGCCKACDVDPREWLTDVLTRIPAYNNDYSLDLADLLPHNWKALKEPQETS